MASKYLKSTEEVEREKKATPTALRKVNTPALSKVDALLARQPSWTASTATQDYDDDFDLSGSDSASPTKQLQEPASVAPVPRLYKPPTRGVSDVNPTPPPVSAFTSQWLKETTTLDRTPPKPEKDVVSALVKINPVKETASESELRRKSSIGSDLDAFLTRRDSSDKPESYKQVTAEQADPVALNAMFSVNRAPRRDSAKGRRNSDMAKERRASETGSETDQNLMSDVSSVDHDFAENVRAAPLTQMPYIVGRKSTPTLADFDEKDELTITDTELDRHRGESIEEVIERRSPSASSLQESIPDETDHDQLGEAHTEVEEIADYASDFESNPSLHADHTSTLDADTNYETDATTVTNMTAATDATGASHASDGVPLTYSDFAVKHDTPASPPISYNVKAAMPEAKLELSEPEVPKQIPSEREVPLPAPARRGIDESTQATLPAAAALPTASHQPVGCPHHHCSTCAHVPPFYAYPYYPPPYPYGPVPYAAPTPPPPPPAPLPPVPAPSSPPKMYTVPRLPIPASQQISELSLQGSCQILDTVNVQAGLASTAPLELTMNQLMKNQVSMVEGFLSSLNSLRKSRLLPPPAPQAASLTTLP